MWQELGYWGAGGTVGDDVGDEEYRIQLLHGMSWELIGR